MHLDPGQSFAKMAFGKSRSTEELTREHAYPSVVSPTSTSPTSTHSLIDLSLNSSEQEAVERLHANRSQLQKEIEVSVCASSKWSGQPRSQVFNNSLAVLIPVVVLQAGCKTRVGAVACYRFGVKVTALNFQPVALLINRLMVRNPLAGHTSE